MAKKLVFSLIFILILFSAQGIFAQQSASDVAKRIEEYQQKLNALTRQRDTLSSEIQYMTLQINLTTLKIQETEEKIVSTQREIEILSSRIKGLDNALNYLSKLLLNKMVESYKNKPLSFFDILFDSQNANDFISRVKYLKTTQENNHKLLVQVQETKLNFEEQKNLREEKTIELAKLEAQLNNQKADLNNQKAAKQNLLNVTKNDEKIYQRLLEQARAEYAAIQGIISGAGTETKLKEVRKGENIALVIPGSSCNSSGGHLHFIVQENGTVTNPFNYLKTVGYSNCSGSACGSSDGDPFNPTGSWDWPLNPAIELEQGYGSTWAVRNSWVGRIYSFHNGLDINGASNNALAVADGELYRGSYSVGCALPYVKLVHKDSNIVTFYLHVYSL
ncbi:hypothetical protein A3C98_02140 [Candidatus Roizmanbacteria bacterium RIFCSPHIGHO2_02_FULL_37_15]|uniref:Peptidoglycan hydrolase PcsB coiled-coil domain-containing protein n=1 Tax=Candidatus Roizmanbacteria bacterium RIFCSPLOWO2_01_FULL_37_16 TaxID=1802058 RepID=A0A1F7IQ78_9BACT|nr:MAG: hypothetical protein A2859_04500 [Candidatus Roizmanbacteria bacterium RIFCSPHIGHO2_01_FULL_37_16b]OGK21194.1 MAG: hypothetical protein A3C98_02140 [Candidatus Roizmanbacteria bacterium RIFCSPHIGHO2_02_FULL_37_15]OGK45517.1 MAG: hypothetical protein A3B40_00680 [Candidatus Roizmanbacteria bacterium RIFCSPLOWO2_01_FULL_37_16]OGK55721.1 MAG: hypothetical protein A3I50_02575 [Candidatus Roizmanbacteria bacterium RIFCSPLOWO2_02_FULL_37_9]